MILLEESIQSWDQLQDILIANNRAAIEFATRPIHPLLANFIELTRTRVFGCQTGYTRHIFRELAALARVPQEDIDFYLSTAQTVCVCCYAYRPLTMFYHEGSDGVVFISNTKPNSEALMLDIRSKPSFSLREGHKCCGQPVPYVPVEKIPDIINKLKTISTLSQTLNIIS